MLPSLHELASNLREGKTTSEELTEVALSRIEDPQGEGSRTFTQVYRDQALLAARSSDLLRRAGLRRSVIDGLPISVKDLFDVEGQVTTAGSAVLKTAPKATKNAVIVQRLLEAGAILVGKTNMTEFAFSGLGINPHYGTPASPWDRQHGRIPGGSSSGAGVAVSDGMSVASIGTDTGGSVRIPSAFCGVTGFKPTASRVSSEGSIPLSRSLDSIGPLAASVQCCAIIDGLLSGQTTRTLRLPHASELRLAVPETLVYEGMDATVKQAFTRALDQIANAGVQLHTIAIPEFNELAQINSKGGLVCPESWQWHRALITANQEAYDPRVASRILLGKTPSAADYLDLLDTRRQWIASVEQRLESFDGMLLPTVPIVAPSIADVTASDEAYFTFNKLILRNPGLINFLDGCALSIPCHAKDEAPVGLMLAGVSGSDDRILNAGLLVESVLASLR
jgi:aspartyl-tRNA(Asn)/glutamyl-tRNA(Gln) amidotransferase subunit A